MAEAIDEGVRRGYEEGYLRKSIVRSPVDRENTGDNTLAIVYYDLVPGDGLKLTGLVKGAGCDNMSALKMLIPAEGAPAMKRFVVETIEKAGPSASPPVTVGVGIGGPFEKAAQLAKKALTHPSGEPNPDPELAKLEKELLEEINATGIGSAGYDGKVRALAVHIESFVTHIAAFPVAVTSTATPTEPPRSSYERRKGPRADLPCGPAFERGRRIAHGRRRGALERHALYRPRRGPCPDGRGGRERGAVAVRSSGAGGVLHGAGPRAARARLGLCGAADGLQDGRVLAAVYRAGLERHDRQRRTLG